MQGKPQCNDAGTRKEIITSIHFHSFIKSWWLGMQQFSFIPAPFDRFNIYKEIFTNIYKGMSFTLRQIRINGN